MHELAPVTDSGQGFAFRHSEALLRIVMESAAVGMVLLGMDYRVIFANRAFGAMLGHGADEVIGVSILDFVDRQDLPLASEAMAPLMAGKIERYRAERRYRRKDGSVLWVLATPSLVRDEKTGEPTNVIVQVTDIDRQKHAEQALADSESRWNHALESAGQGVWDADVRVGVVFYSRMWRVMRGLAPEAEVDGAIESWLTRVHPDDRDRLRDLVHRQNSGEIARNAFEYRERHQDGHYIRILSRGGPVEWDKTGKPVRFVGTDTDITALKAVESALAEEKEKLRVTLQSIGDGVISTDATGCIAFMNAVAEQMTGWPADEATGRPVAEVFTVVDETTGEPMPDPVGEALRRQGRRYLNDSAVLVSRTGDRRAIRDSAAPVRMAEGGTIGAVLVFQDNTHARALQKELAHSALHDSLTGLPNRKSFERALAEAILQARLESREHALCFVDLDRFKQVNDSAGHAAGDALLRKIGQAIRRGCRSQDFVARIGGDEFALLLADCTLAGARKVAQQVVDAIAAARFTWQGQTYEIGASIGLTLITAQSSHATVLLGEADAACYAAKNAGRNQVAVFSETEAGPRGFVKSA